MREILFRAKQHYTKEWLYGAVVKDGDECLITVGKPDGLYKQKMTVVEESTVGQFTGLLDKHGRKIFEGDIIEVDFDNDGPTIGKQKAFIEYSQHHTAFMVRPIKDWAFCEMTEGKIIGNIHDNPELLT